METAHSILYSSATCMKSPTFACSCTAGYAVWFEPSLRIRHHFTLVQRNMVNRHMLNARNEMWSALMRCPLPYVLGVAPFRAPAPADVFASARVAMVEPAADMVVAGISRNSTVPSESRSNLLEHLFQLAETRA